MAQSMSTVLSNIIDKYMLRENDTVHSTVEENNENSNSNLEIKTSPLRQRFTTPLDVTITSISAQTDGKSSLSLQNGPIFHTTYLIYANLQRLTLADIIKEALAGIAKEGEKVVENQMDAKILINKLKAVQHHANHAKDIYDIHSDIGNTCILMYTMQTFWYKSINNVLRGLPAITDEQYKIFAPFCYLLQTYLKKTPVTTVNVPSVVYRGVQLTEQQIEQYKQADNCFHLTAFTSTSINKGKAENFGNVLFHFNLNVINYRGDEIIRVGAYVAPHSDFPEEEEFLIWPLTIFKFEKYEFDRATRKHLIYLKSADHPILTAGRNN